MPAADAIIRRAVVVRRAASLIESGLFDSEFYVAQSGRRFTSDRSAAEHFFAVGIAAGWSPHPLYQEVWYALDTGQPAGVRVLSMLFGAEPLAETSPVFDARAYAAACADEGRPVPGSTRQALEQFLRHAVPETVLPVSGRALGRPTLADARAAAIRTAHEQRRRREDSLTPFSAVWDDDAEARFRAGLTDPIPVTGELVSVIMPVRDRADIVPEAIRSVIAQEYRSWELIVVDDGSVDDTVAVLEPFAAADPRVRIVRQEPAGVSAARNRGIAVATGRYVAFLDSDNRWSPEMLRLSVAALAAPGVCSVHTGARFDLAEGPPMFIAAEGSRRQLIDDQNFIDLNTFVVERKLLDHIGGFDPKLRRWVDHDLFIRLAAESRSRLLPFIGVAYTHSSTFDRISTTESAGWQQVVREKHLIDWDRVRAELPSRDAELVSVLLVVRDDVDAGSRTLRSITDAAGEKTVEIVVIDDGSPDGMLEALAAICCSVPTVRVLRQWRGAGTALALNLAFAASSGGIVAVLDTNLDARAGWLDPLVDALADPDVLGAAPILNAPDGSLRDANWLTAGDRMPPVRLFDGYPEEDHDRVASVRPTALGAEAMVVRAADLAAVDGFDALFISSYADLDLGLRMHEARPGRWLVEPRSRVVHRGSGQLESTRSEVDLRLLRDRWRGRLPEATGPALLAAGLRSSGLVDGADLDRAFVRDAHPDVIGIEPGDATPERPHGRLRWSVKIASPTGELGDHWGDTLFAADLAAAIRAAGHDAVVDRRERHRNRAEHLEDVVLTIRGLDAVVPNPAAVNILWIISHPGLVTEQELLAYDVVFAASETWAERTTARTGVLVRPLLQATEPRRFHPADDSEPAGGAPVFVGSTRGVRRPIVEAAITSGHALAVFGPGWTGLIAPEHHIAEHLSAAEVGVLYRRAPVVLNDHWPEMAAQGFISNRVFDAVASATPVITDPVAGLEALFGPAALVAAGPDEVARLLGDRSALPDRATLLQVAADVARHHSFAARAATLIDAVHDRLGASAIR